jgi:hypothetical protein
MLYYAPRHEDVWGSEGIAAPINVRKWLVSLLGRSTPGGKIRSWVGPRVGLGVEVKRGTPFLA